MLYKTHNKLFNDTYNYKIVIVTPGAGRFRGGDTASILKKLDEVDIVNDWSIQTSVDLQYAKVLCNTLSMMKDFDVRVESPRISIYSNNLGDINYIANLDVERVKYISKPLDGVTLEEGTIVMANRDYDYRVSLGSTSIVHDAFIQWADANADKVLLTNGCRRALSRPKSYGGSYFYIKGDKTLLMSKMHLGSSITKIDRILKK